MCVLLISNHHQSLETRMMSFSCWSCDLRRHKSPILDVQILLQCGQEVPHRHEYVEISPSLFSCALSTPCEVDDLSHICPLPGICYGAKVDSPQSLVPGHWCQFGSVFESFSLTTPCGSCAKLSGETAVRHSDVWPAQPSWFYITIASILVVLAPMRTLALVQRPSHQIQGILLRQRSWNFSRVFRWHR